MMTDALSHKPVMLAEVLDALRPRAGAIYVDGTFGAGGYARALLDAADCRVWAIDRDPDAAARGMALTARYGGRLAVLCGRFGEMDRLLASSGIAAVDGVALDLGVSSMQLDQAQRGFSFRQDGPLDMRMSQQGPSAADVVNGAAEGDLADIIHRFGEEHRARRIARAIVEARRAGPISRTLHLADIVRRCQPAPKPGADTIDPATRTFQALRIHVNDELGELGRGLEAAEALLAPGGRLAVVSFHSLEDRAVKNFLRERGGRAARGSRHLPSRGAEARAPSFTMLGRRAIRPSPAETAANPRARSARLRAAERTAAPGWPRTPSAAFAGGRP
jgi:16S rRNA (cytosine1402-N4)-methyltransferase